MNRCFLAIALAALTVPAYEGWTQVTPNRTPEKTAAIANDPAGETGAIYHGRTIAQWINLVSDDDEIMMSEALSRLAEIGPDAATGAAVAADHLNFRGIGIGIELAAAGALEKMGPAAKAAAPALLAAMKTPADPAQAKRAFNGNQNLANKAKYYVDARALLKIDPSHIADVAEQVFVELSGPDYEGRRAILPALFAELGAAKAQSVPRLIKLLESRQGATRRDAIAMLGLCGDSAKPSVPYLVKLLDSGDSTDGESAARALRRFKDAIPDLTARLAPSVPISLQLNIASALGTFGPNARMALDRLNTLAARFPPEWRFWVAIVRAKIDPKLTEDAVTYLRAAIPTTDPQRRRAILDVIADLQFRPKEILGVLKTLLGEYPGKDSRPEAGFFISITSVLGQMGPDAVPIIADAMPKVNDFDRSLLISLLGQMADARSATFPVLVRALNDPGELSRSGARRALRDWRPFPPPELLVVIRGSDRTPVPGSVEALGDISPAPPEIVPILTELLGDKSIEIRKKAALALASYARLARPAESRLKLMLKDDELAPWAAAALARIDIGGSPEIIPILTDGLAHKNVDARKVVIEALAFLGKRGKPLSAALASAMNKEFNEDVHYIMLQTLRRIDPENCKRIIGPERYERMFGSR